MAKGVEDTAFYRNARLLSLNEVGGDPARFGTSVADFHALCGHLQQRWPLTLVTTTTHDTKRSEDARLRISALSELPEAWKAAVSEWSERARRLAPSPDRMTEYLIWQTLVAAHPISEERLHAYLRKAMREAKLQTSWTNPRASYEQTVLGFASAVLQNAELMQRVGAFVARILPIAWRSSLSQTLLKLTACGVPDIYQGAESWDTRLTDPDNRGRVDFGEAEAAFARVRGAALSDVLAQFEQGSPKLWLLYRVLGLRREHPDWFGPNTPHSPLTVSGRAAQRLVAFARGERVVVLAPRLFAGLLESGFGDTRVELPPGTYRNLLDPDRVVSGNPEVAEALGRFPVGLLVQE